MSLPALLSTEKLDALKAAIARAQHIMICAHRGPDGDAVGSSLAWAEYLGTQGKEVRMVVPTPFPDFLQWLSGSNFIKCYNRHPAESEKIIQAADLVFCLDFNGLARLQEMQASVEASSAPRIVIDHHESPDEAMAQLIISHPEMCSTCEIVFRLIYQLGGYEQMTRSQAASLYTGMMTDTGGFTYNSSRPEIFEIISLLLAKGIDKDKIYRNVFNVYSPDRLRLTGYILYEKLKFYASNHASLFTLTREEMRRFKFIRGDAEGLVNMPLQIKGMRLSISLREDTEKDVVRVSLRSVDDFPCNKMAEEYFHGGGHLNASGGELPFPLSQAIKTVEEAIRAYEYLLYK